MDVGQQRLEPLTTEEAPLVKPAFRRENPQYGMIGRIEATFPRQELAMQTDQSLLPRSHSATSNPCSMSALIGVYS